ncbi:alcohol dehydrogenase catalytic domain-containing protein [Sphaerochaeta sp. PS]|uniref:zinc-dependent alcohol dehydrogenase n=1 Tax=Sphaerochaeta sp. PS TaxID=3076336 RepID=UPI0028A33E5B|nr:alcohol dehydrogenase catalytic domain-containing protein [Sphaerochaeta sp. PS]MDT4761103.1 alcohol dehydrogenase catalytic domain-containing protein [Sphaerochaeta sp. PS]
MQRAYITEPGHMEIREGERPLPKAHELLVKVAYCGICTLEQRLFLGKRTIYYPIIPGHEASGTVVAIGSDVVSNHCIGDHVALDLVTRCHICPPCLSGNSNLCEMRHRKEQSVLGAFSEYMTVKPDQAHLLPKELPLEHAAFTEPLACCIRSLGKVRLEAGETILILGAGTMGLLHMKLAQAMGARAIVCDIIAERLDFARKLGSYAAIDGSDPIRFHQEIQALTTGRGVDCCIITSPAAQASVLAFQSLAPAGRLNIFTSYDDKPPFPIDMNTVHRSEFQITGSEGRSELDFSQAVRVLSNHTIEVGQLISKIYPLADVEDAMAAALEKASYRILIHME